MWAAGCAGSSLGTEKGPAPSLPDPALPPSLVPFLDPSPGAPPASQVQQQEGDLTAPPGAAGMLLGPRPWGWPQTQDGRVAVSSLNHCFSGLARAASLGALLRGLRGLCFSRGVSRGDSDGTSGLVLLGAGTLRPHQYEPGPLGGGGGARDLPALKGGRPQAPATD